MTVEVDLASVLKAAGVWRDQSEQLRGATKALADVDAATSVGPGAVAALTTFLDHWTTHVQTMASTSDAHADALDTAATDLLFADQAAAESVIGLLAR